MAATASIPSGRVTTYSAIANHLEDPQTTPIFPTALNYGYP